VIPSAHISCDSCPTSEGVEADFLLYITSSSFNCSSQTLTYSQSCQINELGRFLSSFFFSQTSYQKINNKTK